MNERFDELKGNIKQGAGKLTGDTDLEAEGRAEHDMAKTKREAKGAANQIKGSVEEGVGRITGDTSQRARGEADQLKGKADRTA